MKKYDIGVLGVWSGCNYGSIATYYALNRILSSMGYSVLMIDKPRMSDKKDVELTMTHSRRFANEHYEISKSYRIPDMKELNEICDTFVIGSDQVWNYGISKNFGKSYYFDFVQPDKKKIAYAASFGHGIDFAPENERTIISKYMKQFDAISVREADGVKICKDIYGVKAEQVLDPVFLADRKIFDELAEKSNLNQTEPYIATYILDPTPEKREAMLYVSQKLGYKLVNMLDGLPWLYEENSKKLGLESIPNLQVEDWIKCFKNSEFVITDSCHGASFALLYGKDFIPITNKRRGYSRFKSLANLFGFADRLVTDPQNILNNDKLIQPMDYEAINNILKEEKKRCYYWLEDALKKPKAKQIIEEQTVEESKVSQDFSRCKMLVSLMRDYGIKHVVLSSGSRNVNLVRLFEANDCFKTYQVIDERSAGFFALGLALELDETVAICCTSGTAASNYLTAVTEAFYQGIPLVVITADRYPYLLGQNEDQTIPQEGIYGSVCKISVSLPTNPGFLGDWEARRKISEALLEVNHNGKGPVHINVPIQSIERAKPKESLLKIDTKYRFLSRVCLSDPESKWEIRVERLKRMKRILVVYGQHNTFLDQKEKELLEEFIDRYKCVVITDHLSNLNIGKKIMSLPILRGMSQETFDKELAPDIVITFGGRRMLNDPITPKLRNTKKPYVHWRVSEDGKIADTFRRLTNVYECSQKYFLNYFVTNADSYYNSDEYINSWKKAEEKYTISTTKYFSQLYAIEHTVKEIPSNSIFHIGIGNTIMFANRFKLKPNVKVFCNMGTNGIDGSASTFMGHAAVSNKLCFLLIGDLSFFYDINSVWNKPLTKNIRIMMFNNSGAGLLAHHQSPAITHQHHTQAKAWVESLGFIYLSARNEGEFNKNLQEFVSSDSAGPIFFEVFSQEASI